MSSENALRTGAAPGALRGSLIPGLIFFALLMSAGYALAGGATSSGTGTLTGSVNPLAAQLKGFDLRTSAGNATVFPAPAAAGTQLAVKTNYNLWFVVYEPNGWNALKYAFVNLWYDNGTTTQNGFTAAFNGHNFRINISYDNTGAATSPTVGQWAVRQGNAAFTASSTTVKQSQFNATTWEFQLTFQLDGQVRWSAAPASMSASGYSNLYGWNARFGVQDQTATNMYYQNLTTNSFLEFGVVRWTSITFAGGTSWTAPSGAPAATVQTPSLNVVHETNMNYTMSVAAPDMSDGSGHSIAITNVQLVKTGMLSANTAFAGANVPLYYQGTSTTYKSVETSANSTTDAVAFRISIPIGTFAATYSTTLTFAVTQDQTASSH